MNVSRGEKVRAESKQNRIPSTQVVMVLLKAGVPQMTKLDFAK